MQFTTIRSQQLEHGLQHNFLVENSPLNSTSNIKNCMAAQQDLNKMKSSRSKLPTDERMAAQSLTPQAASAHQSPPDADLASHWGKEAWLPTCETLSNSSVGACGGCTVVVSVVIDAPSSREIILVHRAHTITCRLTSGAVGS